MLFVWPEAWNFEFKSWSTKIKSERRYCRLRLKRVFSKFVLPFRWGLSEKSFLHFNSNNCKIKVIILTNENSPLIPITLFVWTSGRGCLSSLLVSVSRQNHSNGALIGIHCCQVRSRAKKVTWVDFKLLQIKTHLLNWAHWHSQTNLKWPFLFLSTFCWRRELSSNELSLKMGVRIEAISKSSLTNLT